MVLAKFRQRYPQGSLVSELIDIDRGTYIVGVSVIINNITLATGLAGANTVETAEDMARERAIALLMLDSQDAPSQNSDSISSANSKSHNNQIKTTLVEKPSTQSSSPIVSQQTDKTQSATQNEDSNVVDFSDRSARKTTPSNSVEFQSSFEPETNLEAETNSNTTSERSVLEEESAEDSANLFAGTSSQDTASQDFLTDSQSISTEVAANDSESSEFNNLEEVNFNEIKHQTDLEIKRLGWTKDDGREFLKSRYGKRSRLQLTDNQLLEFLQYLASQPSPS